jgi:nitrogen fixation-related uncharacterized protein
MIYLVAIIVIAVAYSLVAIYVIWKLLKSHHEDDDDEGDSILQDYQM